MQAPNPVIFNSRSKLSSLIIEKAAIPYGGSPARLQLFEVLTFNAYISLTTPKLLAEWKQSTSSPLDILLPSSRGSPVLTLATFQDVSLIQLTASAYKESHRWNES
jgi:hypothetical protein